MLWPRRGRQRRLHQARQEGGKRPACTRAGRRAARAGPNPSAEAATCPAGGRHGGLGDQVWAVRCAAPPAGAGGRAAVLVPGDKRNCFVVVVVVLEPFPEPDFNERRGASSEEASVLDVTGRSPETRN